MSKVLKIAREIYLERQRQDARWGEQNHPDGTGVEWLLDDPHPAMEAADIYRDITNERADAGQLTWLDIALEEVAEAFAETDPVKLRVELIQAAAVFAAWAEAIDRRAA